MGAYAISKFGAEAFSDALRREMSVFGVQVSIIEPGFFQTSMTNRENLTKTWRNLWNGLDKEKQEEYGEECYNTCEFGLSFSSCFSAFRLPVLPPKTWSDFKEASL